jgi:DegV family protein with EDD domain
MVKITADSTCDLSDEIIKDLDITLAPLHIVVDDQVFSDGVDITPTDIFHYVEQEGKSCKTSAVNIYEYKALFQTFAEKYDAVIHICIGSSFSTCYTNARLAAESFSNVYVIDSRNLSSGSGHLVYDAALMARENMDPEEIYHKLEKTVPLIEASFVIDQLEYLHKGGRCSGLEAVGAKLLQIKPCIEVVNGQMKVGKKYRGSFENCLEYYVKDRLNNRTDIDYSRVFLTSPKCSKTTVAKINTLLQSYFDEIIETEAGCTISSHCGPNTLGILYKRKL